MEWDRKSKLLLLVFVVNRAKIGAAKIGVSLYPVSAIKTDCCGLANLQLKKTRQTAGESEPWDGISAGFMGEEFKTFSLLLKQREAREMMPERCLFLSVTRVVL